MDSGPSWAFWKSGGGRGFPEGLTIVEPRGGNHPHTAGAERKGEEELFEEEEGKYRGRGDGPFFVMSHLTATSQRHLPQCGDTSSRITALAKTERRLKELAAKHKYLDTVAWERIQARRVNQEMQMLQEKLAAHLRKGEDGRADGQQPFTVEQWEWVGWHGRTG